MANIQVTYSQNHEPFDALGVPRCHYKHNWLSKNYKFPFHLEFNRTYYKRETNLTAFRILAYTIDDNTSNDNKKSLIYLVQLPNQQLQWIKDFITPETKVYNSVEDYVSSSGTKCADLRWENWWCRFNVRQVHNDTYFFNDEFWTIKDGSAVEKSNGAYFNRFVVTEDGFFVNIGNDSYHSHYGQKGIFLDKLSATKALLNDMSVVDFENAPITIKMNVLDNTPKILKIQIIE